MQRAPVEGKGKPFLNPKGLVIDENLVGVVSELSFELVLPHFRRRFAHVVQDKTVVLKEVFHRLDALGDDFFRLPAPQQVSS